MNRLRTQGRYGVVIGGRRRADEVKPALDCLDVDASTATRPGFASSWFLALPLQLSSARRVDPAQPCSRSRRGEFRHADRSERCNAKGGAAPLRGLLRGACVRVRPAALGRRDRGSGCRFRVDCGYWRRRWPSLQPAVSVGSVRCDRSRPAHRASQICKTLRTVPRMSDTRSARKSARPAARHGR